MRIEDKFGSSAILVLLTCHRFHQRTPRHMMLERGVQSNEAKNVTLEHEAVDMRVDSDRFCW